LTVDGVTKTFVENSATYYRRDTLGQVRYFVNYNFYTPNGDETCRFSATYIVGQNAKMTSLLLDYIENGNAFALGCGYCPGGCECFDTQLEPMVFTSEPVQVGDYAVGTVSGLVLSGSNFVPFSLSFRSKRTN
jgi:hypothetical protein